MKKSYSQIGEFAYVTDGMHTSIDYCADSGISLFSATTPRENYFDLSRGAYISRKAHQENPRTALKENDIIISTVGTIGNCAVVNNAVLPANSDRHVGIIRIKKAEFYPRFISTFLLTKYGRFQTLRESTGNVQLNLFLYKIRELKIPNLSKDFQSKIEALIIDSDIKLDISKKKYAQAEHLLISELRLENFNPSREKISVKTLKESFLRTGRLDSEYYQPKYDDYLNKIKEIEHTILSDEFDLIKDKVIAGLGKYNYIEIGDVNIINGISKPNLIDEYDLPANAKIKPQKGDLIISKVRPNRGAVSVIEEDYFNLVVSGAFTVLRAKNAEKYSTECLKALLKTTIYADWLLKFNVGTSYPVITDEDIMSLPIPILKKEIQDEIARYIKQSMEYSKRAKKLLEISTKAVEIAIDKDEQVAHNFLDSRQQTADSRQQTADSRQQLTMRNKRAPISDLRSLDFTKKSACLMISNPSTTPLKILGTLLLSAEDLTVNIIKKNMTAYLKSYRLTSAINYQILLQSKSRLSREVKVIRQKAYHL